MEGLLRTDRNPGGFRTKRPCLAEGELAPSFVPKWSKRHEVDYLSPTHHLHRLNSEMKLPKFLRPSKSRRQNRSEDGSEISPIKGRGEVDPAVPRPTGSTPDPRIGTPALPMSGSLTPRDQESSGMLSCSRVWSKRSI